MDDASTIEILLEEIQKLNIQVNTKDDNIIKLIKENVGLKSEISKLEAAQKDMKLDPKSTAPDSFICVTVIFVFAPGYAELLILVLFI